ncbi:unnamed protein product [Ambrosiozyma monospora]|uniref:Unnamed protein product n=1 Tax=Ambrosiozyma monospora TaxID=43982 RepID=A0A9W6YT13_AMBMO|nr:unnamed protein product [Ambrosiozyma monospora]
MGIIGKLFACLGGLVLITSYRYVPFAYTIRFHAIAIKYLFVKRNYYLNNFKVKDSHDLFKPFRTSTYCSLLEMDFFGFHKNNATYATELDCGRIDLVLSKFATYFVRFHQKNRRFPFVPLGSIEFHFLKDIKPFQAYTCESRILTWNEKWIFALHIFKVGKKVCTFAVSKLVFKDGRVTIKPEEVINSCGYDTTKLEAVRARNFKLVTSMVDATELLELQFE